MTLKDEVFFIKKKAWNPCSHIINVMFHWWHQTSSYEKGSVCKYLLWNVTAHLPSTLLSGNTSLRMAHARNGWLSPISLMKKWLYTSFRIALWGRFVFFPSVCLFNHLLISICDSWMFTLWTAIRIRLFVLSLKLFQLWPLRVVSDGLPCPPTHMHHCVFCLCIYCLAHPMHFLAQSRWSCFSPGLCILLLKSGVGNPGWFVSVLVSAGCPSFWFLRFNWPLKIVP